MGDQFGRGRAGPSSSSGPRRMEKERGGQEEGSKKRKLHHGGGREEEKEKEKEKGQERKEVQEGRWFSREWGEEKAEEEISERGVEEKFRSSLQGHGNGSQCEAEERADSKDKEKAEEGQRCSIYQREFLIKLRGSGGDRESLRGSVQDLQGVTDGAGFARSKHPGRDEAEFDSVGQPRRSRFGWNLATPDEFVQPHLPGESNFGGAPARTPESLSCLRPTHPREAKPGFGHYDPKSEGPRGHCRGGQLASGAENGTGSTQRAKPSIPPGSSSSTKRFEVGHGCQVQRSTVPGEAQGKRQWEVEGQDQRQEQEQGKGSRWEEGERQQLRAQEKREETSLPRLGGDEESYKLPRSGSRERREMESKKGWSLKRGEKGCLWLMKKGRKERGLTLMVEKTKRKKKAHYGKRCARELQKVREKEVLSGRVFSGDEMPPCVGAAATVFTPSPNTAPLEGVENATNSGMGRAAEKSGHEERLGLLGDMYDWLEPRVDGLEVLCKTTPTGRVYPLPSSPQVFSQLFPNSPSRVLQILRCLVCALNSLNGEGSGNDRAASAFHVKILKGLCNDCERVFHWDVQDDLPTWEEFFRVKGVDYKGEEVLTAQTMQWENVAPALPLEVGGVPLESVVEKGCLHYVKHFEEYLLDPKDQVYVRPPKVMVPMDNWYAFCDNLLKRGIFAKVHEDDLYRVQGKPVLSGLFGVSKHEFSDGYEVQRIIMNLVPLNAVCRAIDGDISTLPSWAGMTPLNLQPTEDLVVSSEDVRAFFYIFRVPESWHKFLAFNRPLPDELGGGGKGKWYPCSSVLPMDFKNSVSLAQHVHRVIVKQSLQSVGGQGGEAELRKDKPYPSSNPVHRIYLDNFDQLEKISKDMSAALKGEVSPLVQGLREEYQTLGVPRHPKKAVTRSTRAEVQGAMVDGVEGVAHPKIEKIARYAHLTRLVLQAGESTQRQMQVVGGGLVYMCMFRRPLLSSLNHIWKFITACEGYPSFIRFPLPEPVIRELTRFLGLLPVAYMDFRSQIQPLVTASDASEFGGGVTASVGLTPAGVVASTCPTRGDIVEPSDITPVLTVGVFDGIGALRVAADVLGWNVQGHVSIEKSKEASRVVESRFPNSIFVDSVESVDEAMVKTWAQQFSQVGLIVVGGGPPCQGVSGLNAARKGALRDSRSSLFVHVSRIRELCKKCFPWAQVMGLMESVASMDEADEVVMSKSFGGDPWFIDAAGLSLAHRPRLYWLDWEVQGSSAVKLGHTPMGRPSISFHEDLDTKDFLEPGWHQCVDKKLPTFTTSRPRDQPGYKPAGIHSCQPHEVTRWQNDRHRFPPYQYVDANCLINSKGEYRLPSIQEREVIMGFPKNYTSNCLPKAEQKKQHFTDTRLTLIGNSWNVTVVAWLLGQLGQTLGLNPPMSPKDIVQRTTPGSSWHFQAFLQRPFMRRVRSASSRVGEELLVNKFLSLISIKGEDILLQSSSEDLVKYHRLRASIPANLWRWKAVASWSWVGAKEHINSLELRAVLTALRWRIERHHLTRAKFVHLIDSLVVLHALSIEGVQAVRNCGVPCFGFQLSSLQLSPSRGCGPMSTPPKTQRMSLAAVRENESGLMPKRHLEAHTQAERAKVRKKLGTLKSLTVQPITRARYQSAKEDFYKWLRQENLLMPGSPYHLDLVVSDYLEHLWASGCGRTTGSNILAALQDTEPHLKGKLKGSWRSMKAWVTNEVPNRAPPLSIDALHTLVGYGLFKKQPLFALSLLLAFHGLLRTGELLTLQAKHCSISSAKGPLVVSLGLTKSGKRQGAAESVTIHNDDVCRRMFQWLKSTSGNAFLAGPGHIWRKTFATFLEKVGLDKVDYRPYSLRRGGATFYFQKLGSFDKLLVLGRWQAAATARIYVNEGLSVLAEMETTISAFSRNLRSQYVRSLTQPLPKLGNTKQASQRRGRWKNKRIAGEILTTGCRLSLNGWSLQLLWEWPGSGVTHRFLS